MKRINLTVLLPDMNLWRADSNRYGVSAYGRTVAEAKQRLFLMVWVERCNSQMARFDNRPRA